MKIEFCGAATGVTGSCHLIKTQDKKVLLDCGQFQGGKAMEKLNYEPFPFDPSKIDALILSHAHIDHCGRIPLLIKRGFKGDIYCTSATADLLEVMLKDSGYIHEKEAEWANKKNQRLGRPLVEPLYTSSDASESLKYIKPVLYDQLIAINDSMDVVFNDAGHILGSAIVELWVTEGDKRTKTVFSGDLGVMDRPILRNPTKIKKADYVIMESTYGDRLHPKNSTSIDELMKIIVETYKRGGTVVIPAFAVGRTQELIYQLNRFYHENSEYKSILDKLMVYVDSPMATNATEVFKKNSQVFDEETKEYILHGDHPLDFKNLRFTRTSEESQALNRNREPKIIISASGMCDAGRIRHHLKHNIWDSKSSIVFVGYQANGTLGRQIVEGAKYIALFGEEIKVNAQIHNLEGFSGHADRDGLLDWLSSFENQPKRVFIVHGEDKAKHHFAEFVNQKLGYMPTVVEDFSEHDLEVEFESSNAKSDIYDEIIDREKVEEIRGRLEDMHMDIESIMYNTTLAIGQKASSQRIVEISNMVIELQKAIINLGAKITEEDRSGKVE